MSFIQLAAAMEAGNRITLAGMYLSGGTYNPAISGRALSVTGYINSIAREDGSGKCWIVNVASPVYSSVQLFMRTR